MLRHDKGIITEIMESAAPATGPRSLVIPAFVNAHDHARPRASSFGALGMPLESWILRSALGTPVDPYLTAVSALARSARAGCAAMMVHYTRPSGSMDRSPRRVVRAPRIMSKYYRAILDLLLARGFAAPREPVRVTKLTKLAILFRYAFI